MAEEDIDFDYLKELTSMGKIKEKISDTSTSSSSSKKVTPRGPDGAAIKAVLEKKKFTEETKAAKFKKDREDLLALRATDKTSFKRMSSMIKRTKGYSKAVIEDAKDLTTVRGEQQCDEDDYGYESTMSQQIFDKLATQYSEMPDDERLKFKKVRVDSIADVKSRVLNSLKRQEEEENGPRKRKRKHGNSDEFINDGNPYDETNAKDDNIAPDGSRSKTSSSSGEDKKEKPKKPEHRLPVNLNLTNYQTKDNDAFKYDYDKKREREDKEKEREREKKKRRVTSSQPPALNFMDLMKLAQAKQHGAAPDKVEDLVQQKIKEKEALVKKKSERPLTAQEKEELENERLRKLRRSGKLPNLSIEKLKQLEERKKNKENDKKEEGRRKEDDRRKDEERGSSSKRSSSKEHREEKKVNEQTKRDPSLEKPNKQKEPPVPEPKVRDRSKYFAVPATPKPTTSSGSSKSILESRLTEGQLKAPSTFSDSKSKAFESNSKQRLPDLANKSKITTNGSNKSTSSSNYQTPDSKSRLQSSSPSSSSKSSYGKPSSSASSSSKPSSSANSSSSKSRPFPPANLKPHKSAPPPPTKTRQFPPPDVRRSKPPVGGGGGRFNRVDSDEDSEYDSEMDDFIDDGEEELDYSSEIKKMFGYDKSKFRDEDDDIDDMEVGYGQVEKEERRSAKLGLLEDLEDMRQEEEERKRKMMIKKKATVKGRR